MWIWEEKVAVEPDAYIYSDLLERHKDPYTNSRHGYGLYALLQFVLIAIVIYLRKRWIFFLYIGMVLIQGSFWIVAPFKNWNDAGRYLYHQQTIEFDRQVYHLTIEKTWANDATFDIWAVLLFECDAIGERCGIQRYYQLDESYDEKPEASIEIDAESGALEMVVDGEQVYEISAAP
jgi:hypothetical protein